MPSSETSQQGIDAERAAARKYGLEGAGGPGYADLTARNGVVYSVKSTVHTRANGKPGRFRFQRQNFEQLHAAQSAVILVLYPSVGTTSSRPLRIEKVSTSRVLEAIQRAGGWVDAGHLSFREQRRISWPELIP